MSWVNGDQYTLREDFFLRGIDYSFRDRGQSLPCIGLGLHYNKAGN